MIRKLYWYLFVYDLNDNSGHKVDRGKSLMDIVIKDTAWLILYTYFLVILSPAIPVFADLIAHTFWEKEHLELVHKVKGECHLKTDLLKIEKQSGKSRSGSNSKSGLKEGRCVLHELVYRFKSYFIISNSYALLSFFYLSADLTPEYRPPRVNLI